MSLRRFHVKHWVAAAVLDIPGMAWAGSGNEAVSFPGSGLGLAGRLCRPPGPGPFPAIVMPHGCSGMWDRRGQPNRSLTFWPEHFRARGYAALLVDSFGPRGEREICTQAKRRISPARDRSADTRAALRWLAAGDDIDGGRIHAMGWSSGAASVLHALRVGPYGRREGEPRFRSAVVFYPGCAVLAAKPYRPEAPVLIQAGEEDDWTPARLCAALAAQVPDGQVEIDIYPGAHHAFDAAAGSLRERPGVSNPNRPGGRGATVGPNPEARGRAIARATHWLEECNR